jgi:hypothetical protein
MSLRRAAPLAVALLVMACQPSLNTPSGGQVPPPSQVNAAVFDPTTSAIPVPNDLALQSFGPPVGSPATAFDEFKNLLLNTYVGFPPDQSGAAITFASTKIDPDTRATSTGPAPDLDLTSLGPATVAIVRTDTGEVLQVDADASGYDVNPSNPNVGTLTLVPVSNPITQSRRWPQGAPLVIALRGGPNGVKTKSGDPIGASLTLQLLLSDIPLTDPTNPTKPNPALAGSTIYQTVLQQAGMAGLAQLEGLRQLYVQPKHWAKCPLPSCPNPLGAAFPQGTWIPLPPQGTPPLSAFAAIDTVFPHQELASVQTFTVGTLAGTWVDIDSAAGKVPLPSDLISLPGLVYSNGAPTPAGKAFGALAPGLATLDGFSTTAMLLAPTSSPVAATTITNTSTLLFDLSTGSPAQVATLVTEPPPVTLDTATGKPCTLPFPATCVSTVIGLQPATVVPGPTALPPLKEATQYLVVVTDGVKDVSQPTPQALVKGTVARFLLDFSHPLCVTNINKSTVPGISDSQACGLETLRTALQGTLLPAVSAALGSSQPVMAYTFKTQSITGRGNNTLNPTAPKGALQLAALPFTVQGLPDAPAAASALTVTAAGQKYGVPTGSPPTGVLDPTVVSSVVEATIVTFDLLDPATGAFLTDSAKGKPTLIPALVVIPKPVPVGAPLVVFGHGLGEGRADALLLATALAEGGMVAAAIDAVKFGDRAWCKANTDCATGTCVPDPALANQGDAPGPTPGFCKLADGSPGQFAYNPVAPPCTQASGCWNGTGGNTKASGNYFVSGNLFRTRDSMRQDVLDKSVLVRALTSANGQAALQAAIGSTTFAIDPTKVYYVGQSFGSIEGTPDVAANPFFSKTVLNVGGGTFIDIATTSPTYKPLVAQVLGSLTPPITVGSPQYLQFVQVAKWVLDPADPINFASHLITDPLPNLLPPLGGNPDGSVPQAAKVVLGQAARCDNNVPNSANQLLYGLVGLSPLNPLSPPATPPLEWFMVNTVDACPADGSTGPGGATHGFLLDFANQSLTLKAQGDVASFLAVGTISNATPVTP